MRLTSRSINSLWRILAIALMMGTAYAQSKLPACQGNISLWSNCVGSATFANGDKYVGEYKDGKLNGQGTYFYLADNQFKGDKYVGEYKDGKRDGQGTYTKANGAKYVGEFKDSNYSGQGTVTLPNGTKFVGEWRDNKLNGYGTFTVAGRTEYVGEWKDNKFNGQGILTRDGTKYVGEFKDDQPNGQGTHTLANGDKYVGEYKNGKRNGQGTEYASNGSIINQGLFAEGRLIRSMQVQQANVPDPEIARLRAEAEEAKRRQAELENQLRLAQQTTQPTQPTQQATSQPNSKRIALVVGNANYKVRPLKNPRNDADDISRSLRSSGFEVIDLRDATFLQMRTAVREFGDKLLTHDVGLVYYSGHGVEVKGRNYFIPVNADIMREDEIADQGLDVSLILEKMSTAGKGVNILIVDACRDDPFGRSFRSSSRGLAQMDAPRGTIIAYATSPGKVASDGDARERNSPYTKHLLRAMQSPNKPIEQLFKEVRRAVQEETKYQQTPWENTSLSGDFFFKVQR